MHGNFLVETTYVVADPAVRKALWEGFCEAHEDSGELCVQEQRCYTAETFDAAMSDPEYVKFVLYDDGVAVGLIGGTNNLEKARVAYVNPQRLIACFPDAAQGKLWYMPLLFIRQAWQKRNCANLLFEAMTAFFVANGASFAYDFANDKHPRFLEMLDKTVGPALAKICGDTLGLRHSVLGGQTYCISSFVPPEKD